MDTYIPYCGAPPLPADLWSRWLLDPLLLTGLAVALVIGLYVARDRLRLSLGWALVVILFVSPLCAASMALFSARVAQHILLTFVAAPLIAAALPRYRLPALPAAMVFAGLFWFWHAPLPYQATLSGDLTYWAMHISLFGAATALFAALRGKPEHGLPAAALTGAQMTTYAVMLTLSPVPWHDFHLATTLPYGLGPLADQQLAGALMWVVGGLFFMVVIGTLAFRFVQRGASEPRPLGAE